MKKATLFLLFAAAAVASADTKIATVDMDLVVLSHPKNEENREQVAKIEEQAAETRNQARGELAALEEKLKEAEMYLERTLVKRPDEPAVLNNLSIIYRKTNRL